MAYEIILNEKDKTIQIHYDLCDALMEKKDNFVLNNEVMYITFNMFDEIEEFLKKHEDYEVIYCDICKPLENKEEYDEEYDDFYEEFPEDEDIDDSRCDIF
jgi:hypothetical protein